MTVTQSPHYSLPLSPHLSSRKKDSNCFIVLGPGLNECMYIKPSVQVVVQSLNRVQLFATPWTAAHQPSLDFTVSQNLLKLRTTESVMPPNYLPHPLSPPFPLAFNLCQHQSLFQRVSSSHPKHWSFSFNISPSNEYSRLISFRIDRCDLLAIQGTLKSLLLLSGKRCVNAFVSSKMK